MTQLLRTELGVELMTVWLLSHCLSAKIVVSLQATKFRPFWNFMGTQKGMNEEDSTPRPFLWERGVHLLRAPSLHSTEGHILFPCELQRLNTPFLWVFWGLSRREQIKDGSRFLYSCDAAKRMVQCISHENGWAYNLFLPISCNSVCVSIANIHIGGWVTRLWLQDHQNKCLYWSRDHCWAGSGSYLWCFNSQM